MICRNLSIGNNGGAQIVNLTVQPIIEPAACAAWYAGLTDVAKTWASPSNGRQERGKRTQRDDELGWRWKQSTGSPDLAREMQSSQEELKSTNGLQSATRN